MKPVVVVKIGGAAMASGTPLAAFARELASLHERGWWPVVVHGGGPALTAMLTRLGVESRFVDGHRVTSAEAAEVAEMVLSGRINKEVVTALLRAGVSAIGLSGTDAGILSLRRHAPGGADIGFVGVVESVNAAPLHLLLEHGYLPVLSSTASGPEGLPYNVNADVVAGAVAAALSAEKLLFLSDVDGVMVDGKLAPRLDEAGTRALLASGEASGGMRPKLEAALAALAGGVEEVILVDGRAPGAVLEAVLSGPLRGTVLRSAAPSAEMRRLA